tara:strand:- start:100 stop:660 length:561 start_codon:yes stop_codon:yes gene_type:complete
MTDITIKIGDAVDKPSEEESDKPTQTKLSMEIRRTVDGNYIITDHPNLDIIVLPEGMKVLALAKESFGDQVYDAQNRLFNFLNQKGVIVYDSVQGGNVYSSLEAEIPESKIAGVDSIQAIIFSIGKFLAEEKPYFEQAQQYIEDEERRLLDPSEEDSTELGEVPHEETKGSNRPGMTPYAMYYEYR